MNDFTVYMYYVPGEDLPFYVGKGKPGRAHIHLCPSVRKQHTHFYHKLNKLIDIDNIYPIIDIIAKGLSERQAFDLEVSLIKIYGRQDQCTGCLCNHTDGGEGATGTEVSVDARVNMSKPRSLASKTNMIKAQSKRGTPVESYSLTTGLTVKQYPSICAARRDGYTDDGIRKFIQGQITHHALMGWRYSEKEAS